MPPPDDRLAQETVRDRREHALNIDKQRWQAEAKHRLPTINVREFRRCARRSAGTASHALGIGGGSAAGVCGWRAARNTPGHVAV